MSDPKSLAWLNEAFVERAFKNCNANDGKKVTKVSAEGALGKGENFMSEMLRVNVDYIEKNEKKKTTLIVKLAPQEGLQKSLATELSLFACENNMMSDTLVKMNNMIGPNHKFNAKLLFNQTTEPVLMVLEDLAPYGCRMADKRAGLDMNHTLVAIRTLAKFHASSAVLVEKEPQQKSKYPTGMLNHPTPPDFVPQFFCNNAKNLADEMAKWPEAKQWSSKLAALSPNIYKIGLKYSARKDDEFNVINHGDFWINNMMFLYDDKGKPKDLIMVDFQLSCYTSPAMDLCYFMNMSLKQEIYMQHKEELIKEYHKTLAEMLQKLGYKGKIPSLDDIKRIMKERGIVEMIVSVCDLPMTLAEKTEAKDVNDMMDEEGKWDIPGYSGAAYRKIICERMPLFAAAGYLDEKV